MPKRKWFKEIAEEKAKKGHKWGFDKEKSIETNTTLMTELARKQHKDKREASVALVAARRAQALANVTTDPETQEKAEIVAKRLFGVYNQKKGSIKKVISRAKREGRM